MPGVEGCTVNITMTDEQYFSNLYKLRSHNDKFGIFLYLKISGRSVQFNIEILHTRLYYDDDISSVLFFDKMKSSVDTSTCTCS